MNQWTITQKPAFLTDFVDLNKDLQQAVAGALKDLEADPITPRGNTIKKMTGYENVYRYRLGAYRLLYAAELKAQMVQLLAIGPRGHVYKRFDFPGWDAPETAVEFGPELAAKPEWMAHEEWFQPPEQEEDRLPRKLSPSLLTRWRIDPQYHPTLMRCLTADELLRQTEGIPEDVLERVMDGLYPATVERLAGQPDQMVFDPEDLLRYAEGDLAGFLLKLDKQQEPLTSWALSGPTLVKGGPGSGKSTVALYRLRALVEHHLEENGNLPQVLFTTYTNSLINFSESLLRSLLRDKVSLQRNGKLPRELRVTTLHKTASWIARSSGEKYNIAGSGDQHEALIAARSALQPRGLGDAHKIPLAAAVQDLRDDYLLEEFDWVIEGQNCRSLDDYLAADRAGRGIPFPKQKRTAVWKLYEAYHQHLLDKGLYSWGQLILFALDRVKSGEFGRRWDYVIVDEAQDLPPAALALAVELCRNPAGVFLTADANQSLYNRGFRWGNVHEQLQVKGRSRILQRNYRSTRQIAAAAADVVAGVPEMDKESIEQEYVHTGLPPLVYAASGSKDQWRWIAGQIYESARELRLPVNAATVLVSSSEVGEPLARALSDHGLPARFMNSRGFNLDEPCIKVTTLHAANGLEFPIVVIAHVEAGRLPRPTSATEPEELNAYEQAQRRLFYVGCTRAMRHLFVTYERDLPSPFVADMTAEHWQRVG